MKTVAYADLYITSYMLPYEKNMLCKIVFRLFNITSCMCNNMSWIYRCFVIKHII